MEYKKFKVGRHLRTGRLPYRHHDIYIEEGLVIRCAFDGIVVNTVGKSARGEVMEEAPRFDSPYVGEEIRRRVSNRLGKDRYDLMSSDREHFVNWRCTGETEPEQIEEMVRLAGILLLKILGGC